MRGSYYGYTLVSAVRNFLKGKEIVKVKKEYFKKKEIKCVPVTEKVSDLRELLVGVPENALYDIGEEDADTERNMITIFALESLSEKELVKVKEKVKQLGIWFKEDMAKKKVRRAKKKVREEAALIRKAKKIQEKHTGQTL